MEDGKKVERKRKRFAARLKTSKGIQCKDEPSPNIVICNLGQATGLEKQTIINLLDQLDGVKLLKFVAEKGESHSFVVFQNSEDAELFYKTWNGRSVTEEGEPPIYMSYVEDVPNTEVIWPGNNPDGLTLIENFISVEEERQLIELFDWVEESNLKNRLVKHYGYEFRYGSNDVDLTSPMEEKIPGQCDVLWVRLKEHGVEFDIPDQLTVNKYLPGQGIPSHVDRHSPFGETILSLSLGSTVLMDWRHHSGAYVPVVVPSRSMLIMQGEARYDWQHGIQPRAWDHVVEARSAPEPARVVTQDTVPRGTRISLTFRRTRRGPCECPFPALCDRGGSTEIDEKVAADLEELHVHQVYEQIAAHFASTRQAPWPRVARWLQAAPRGAVLLDLGAGSGRHVAPRSDIVQIACERSEALSVLCAARGAASGAAQVVRLDVRRAPLRDACADRVICIAVLHHLSTESRRREAIETIARLLRAGGLALLTVWAREQRRSGYVAAGRPGDGARRASAAGLRLPVHESRTPFRHGDLLVPWRLRGPAARAEPLLRYYHVFEEGELERLCAHPRLALQESYYEEGNWCVVVKKI